MSPTITRWGSVMPAALIASSSRSTPYITRGAALSAGMTCARTDAAKNVVSVRRTEQLNRDTGLWPVRAALNVRNCGFLIFNAVRTGRRPVSRGKGSCHSSNQIQSLCGGGAGLHVVTHAANTQRHPRPPRQRHLWQAFRVITVRPVNDHLELAIH